MVPWVEYGLDQFGTPPAELGPPTEGDLAATKAVKDQVRAGLAFLQCLRTMSSASYFEEGALVTHSEWRLEDQK
jgi:hypothetical protein